MIYLKQQSIKQFIQKYMKCMQLLDFLLFQSIIYYYTGFNSLVILVPHIQGKQKLQELESCVGKLARNTDLSPVDNVSLISNFQRTSFVGERMGDPRSMGMIEGKRRCQNSKKDMNELPPYISAQGFSRFKYTDMTQVQRVTHFQARNIDSCLHLREACHSNVRGNIFAGDWCSLRGIRRCYSCEN